MDKIEDFQGHLNEMTPEQVIRWALARFGVQDVVLASSIGAEDQVLTDMMLQINPLVRIITLDTGRHFQETYDTMQKTMRKYQMNYEFCFPDPLELELLISVNGPNLFYESVEKRKLCCDIRKIRPLKRALTRGKSSVKAWITGLRQEQSLFREKVTVIEWDSNLNIYKINPLYTWRLEQVFEYLETHQVPYNPLHNQGFTSIGCACCTRAVKEGEDFRSGRWWWENEEKKECGLHPGRQHG